MKRLAIIAGFCIFASCGDPPEKLNSDSKVPNGSTNNGSTNNGSTNNGSTNNSENSQIDCAFDVHCPDTHACEDDVCVATCESDADCLVGELCREGAYTQQMVCRMGEINSEPNNASTNNSINNVQINNDNSSNNQEVYHLVQIVSVTTDPDACGVPDPGPDIFGVSISDATGAVLGWGNLVWEEVQFDGNEFLSTAHLDGSQPAIDAGECVDFSEETIVSLGCNANNFIAVEFLDPQGNPIALDATAGQTVTVYEYGAQCTTSGFIDEYDISICTDTSAVWDSGDVSSCNLLLLAGAAGAVSANVEGW